MGWYGDNNVECPKCLGNNAAEQYRNSILSDYYLVCPDCGLCLYCKEKQWIVTSSYINSTIIGKDPRSLAPVELVNTKIDNCEMTAGLPKGYNVVRVKFGWRVFALLAAAGICIYFIQYLPF